MRTEGDILFSALAAAKRDVLLCAPFIKAPVLARLLSVVAPRVSVDVVTRWHPKEVAAGVSDLEVYDLITARPGSTLRLLDRLHAKLYRVDDVLLAGSANLTATALGWCAAPNVELLIPVMPQDAAVRRCLAELTSARIVTAEERDEISSKADGIATVELPGSEQIDERLACPWLPRSGAPARLYQVYLGRDVDRLMNSVVESARYDLDALSIAPGLDEASFMHAVAERFVAMPAISTLLHAVRDHLADAEAIALIGELEAAALAPDMQWLVIKEWLTYFMSDEIEVVPQSFVVRPRPGGAR